ncbi:MAG TPA: hypothetical protein VFB72_06740 [Verrucomicrobiae bacterium]|nr:hypothetical protein [Verrucomicrobiae bacterium]
MHSLHIGTGKVITPRQAIAISAGGVAVCAIGVVVAYALFFVPFWEAMMWSGIGVFFSIAFPWASLQLETRNRAVRAHNCFVYFVIAMLIVVVIAQWGVKGGKPFPNWALFAVIAAGVSAYSVMAFYAIVNFQKWIRGDFKNLEMPKM